MRVYTLTFNFALNYGAQLQMYALQKYLEKNEIEVSVVNYHPKWVEKRDDSFSIKNLILKIFNAKKRKIFEKFQNDYIHFTTYCRTIQDIEFLPQPDCYIAGSDQIWNSDLTRGIDKAFFLDFKTTAKKIFYAASIGIDELSIENLKLMIPMLSKCDAISVREKNLQNEMNIPEIPKTRCVLDPSFLLEKDDYLRISKNIPMKKYVLIYQMRTDNRCYELAKKIADKYNLSIVEIGALRKKNGVNEVKYFFGPAEFLGYFLNAEYIVTNSFHGTVFSIIFRKQFFTVELETNQMRITSLLQRLRLMDRVISSTNIQQISISNIDYSICEPFINKEILKSKEFLEQVITGKLMQ